PAKLTSERRDSICAQCHLSGAVRIQKAGRDLGSFRPGDRLSDYLSIFVLSDASRDLKVTSHFEKYARSRCKLASGDRLWCGTCHDPHSPPADTGKVDYFRQKCLECHAGHGCTEKRAVRTRAGNNCIGCHMPQSAVTDVQHAAYTDHSIPRRPAAASKAASTNCLIEPFAGAPEPERDLALAYAQVAIEKNDPVCGTRAFELLRKLEPLNPRDPAILVQLAYLYDLRSKEAEAAALYERALESDPGQVTAAINLGAVLSKTGRVDRAMQLWKETLMRSPGAETASVNLALAQYRAGDTRSADVTLTRALRLSPGSPMLRRLLSEFRQAAPR
ncbi:MAG TPA: tetratricopeptide repeat protein, partial [Bryobacteraceae bacterium]|nr:tetratricopeptide repeat protein [Bryobacteraceae bacterium]